LPLLGILLLVIFDRPSEPARVAETSATHFQGSTQRLGEYLFNKQLVNLELAGLILTVAMVGAIVIARKRVINPDLAERGAGVTETLVAPMTPIDDDPHSIP